MIGLKFLPSKAFVDIIPVSFKSIRLETEQLSRMMPKAKKRPVFWVFLYSSTCATNDHDLPAVVKHPFLFWKQQRLLCRQLEQPKEESVWPKISKGYLRLAEGE